MSQTERDTESSLSIELTGRNRARFDRIKQECKNDHVPAPSDEELLKSLLDTWDAVGDGHYSGETSD